MDRYNKDVSGSLITIVIYSYTGTGCTVLQGESKKTDTFVIHLNIKCISFF